METDAKKLADQLKKLNLPADLNGVKVTPKKPITTKKTKVEVKTLIDKY